MGAFTFEEDKLPLAVLINSIDLGWQPPPEHTDEHGVARHHSFVTHPPEPVVLNTHTHTHTQIYCYTIIPGNSLCNYTMTKII